MQICAYSGCPTVDEEEKTVVTGNQELTELWAEYMLVDEEGVPTKTANGTHVNRFQLDSTFDLPLDQLWQSLIATIEGLEQ